MISILEQAAKLLDPSNIKSVERIDNIVNNLLIVRNLPNSFYNDSENIQLFFEFVSPNDTEHNFFVRFKETFVDFTLQTRGVNELVAAVLAFQTHETEVVQTPESNTLASTHYIAPENTTYIVIVGLNAKTYPRVKRSSHKPGQLSGNTTFAVSTPSLESVCIKLAEEKQLSHLVIKQLDPSCTYYESETKSYSDSGCVTISDTGNVTCKCGHLTVFAVLLAADTITIPNGVKVLCHWIQSCATEQL